MELNRTIVVVLWLGTSGLGIIGSLYFVLRYKGFLNYLRKTPDSLEMCSLVFNRFVIMWALTLYWILANYAGYSTILYPTRPISDAWLAAQPYWVLFHSVSRILCFMIMNIVVLCMQLMLHLEIARNVKDRKQQNGQ